MATIHQASLWSCKTFPGPLLLGGSRCHLSRVPGKVCLAGHVWGLALTPDATSQHAGDQYESVPFSGSYSIQEQATNTDKLTTPVTQGQDLGHSHL